MRLFGRAYGRRGATLEHDELLLHLLNEPTQGLTPVKRKLREGADVRRAEGAAYQGAELLVEFLEDLDDGGEVDHDEGLQQQQRPMEGGMRPPPSLVPRDESLQGFTIPDIALSHIQSNQVAWKPIDVPDDVMLQVLQHSLKE